MPDWWKEKPNILKIGSNLERKVFLDLGCGNGDTKKIVEGAAWVGIDIEIVKNISICSDANNLPFKDDVFDLVMSFKVLEHLNNIDNFKKVVKEIKRVLKNPGYFIGSVAFLEPYHDSFYHFTHVGLANFLNENGFIIDEMTAGWSVFETIINWLVPFSILKKTLMFFTKIFYKLLLYSRKIYYIIYVKYLGYNEKKLSTFLNEDKFKWAGELRFISRLHEPVRGKS